MHRFYLAPDDWHQDALVLKGTEAHHCRNVLRLEPADRVVLFNGQGREITAEIVSSNPVQINLRKLYDANTPPLRCRITLGQAIPKGKNMDLIVQKAVEIGAAEIAPILSDRTVVRLDDENGAAKQMKWQSIAIEAAKQCGQNWLPQVQTPQTLIQFFQNQQRFDLQLIGSLQSDAVHLKKFSRNIRPNMEVGLPLC
jgi:16S rRNA (uracil1498-N3)-methyltransferase